MTRTLPCSNCGTAWLKDAQARPIIPYTIGVTPSAFRTPGQTFEYDCQKCQRPVQVNGKAVGGRGARQSISKQAYFALPVS